MLSNALFIPKVLRRDILFCQMGGWGGVGGRRVKVEGGEGVNSKDTDTKIKPKINMFYFSSEQEKELAGRKEQAK